MILLHYLHFGVPAFDLLYTVLPLAVGGFFTASVIAVQWFVGLLSTVTKVPSKTIPSQKEHIDETNVS